MIKKLMPIYISVCGIVGLIICGADISAGIGCGLSVCGEVVIPSLFPFMVMANFIAASGAADLIGKWISYITKPIFRLTERCATPIFLSYISGYPIGAAMAKRLFDNGEIGKRDAERMLTFTVNSSPAMAIFAVGAGMFGSRQIGFLIFGVHVIASVLTGLIFTRVFIKNDNSISAPIKNNSAKSNLADAFVGAVSDASISMLGICGCVILFAGITRSFDNFKWSAMLLEVTVGCKYATRYGLPTVSAVLGFGGASVIMQILTLSKGLIRPHILILSRVTHAAIAFSLCKAALCLLPDRVISVLSTGVPNAVVAVNITAPVSAALLLLSVVIMASAKKAEN